MTCCADSFAGKKYGGDRGSEAVVTMRLARRALNGACFVAAQKFRAKRRRFISYSVRVAAAFILMTALRPRGAEAFVVKLTCVQ